jgi:hypothetical protein
VSLQPVAAVAVPASANALESRWALLPPSGLAPNRQSPSTAYMLAEQNLVVMLLCLSAVGVAGAGFLGLIASVLLVGLRPHRCECRTAPEYSHSARNRGAGATSSTTHPA